MKAGDEDRLKAAERRARQLARQAEESEGIEMAEEAANANEAAAEASRLIGECLDRLAQADWPPGEEISYVEWTTKTFGLLRKRKRRMSVVRNEVVWIAPAGVGYRAGQGYFDRNSQMAIARDGTLWFGRFHGEKQRHDWERIGLPANEAEVDSLIEVLGALLATHIRE